ncbi:MAG: hypothetical protein JXR42_03940 [Gammaproteobacteria bacterium]|nr:hypothetical protein [Gammaproteobacteria bacterium]
MKDNRDNIFVSMTDNQVLKLGLKWFDSISRGIYEDYTRVDMRHLFQIFNLIVLERMLVGVTSNDAGATLTFNKKLSTRTLYLLQCMVDDYDIEFVKNIGETEEIISRSINLESYHLAAMKKRLPSGLEAAGTKSDTVKQLLDCFPDDEVDENRFASDGGSSSSSRL